MQTGRKLRLLAASFAAALVLAGCGGGGGTEPPRTSISKVVVAGDSLADVGTFGYKFTVQNSADPAAGYPVYPQIVAANFGVTSQCAFFRSSNGVSFTTTAGCTNFAVGDSRIFNPASHGGDTAPYAVSMQLATALQANGGSYAATDLLVVDGGGNDAADLVSAYLAAASSPATYQAFLLQLLTPAELAAASSPEAAAGLYMQKLADRYYAMIKTNALDKGATHVAVLNIPNITLTPRLQQVLAGVTAQAGAARAEALRGAVVQWLSAFNARLQADVAGDTRVALVDFYADMTDEISNPTQYGLSNVTTPACPVTGSSGGLPTYTFTTCTSAALDAAPPAGMTAGWWKTYTFSDSFHPTPFAHSLLASSVSRAIARAGWL
jgi:phospholipase/lecithinase/hemolysin